MDINTIYCKSTDFSVFFLYKASLKYLYLLYKFKFVLAKLSFMLFFTNCIALSFIILRLIICYRRIARRIRPQLILIFLVNIIKS